MNVNTFYIDQGTKLTIIAHLGVDAFNSPPQKTEVDKATADLKAAFPAATVVVLAVPIETLSFIAQPIPKPEVL